MDWAKNVAKVFSEKDIVKMFPLVQLPFMSSPGLERTKTFQLTSSAQDRRRNDGGD